MNILQWESSSFGAVAIHCLYQNASSKEMQIILPKGESIKEHKASSHIIVQVLKGKIWFESQGERNNLDPFDMVTLEANIPHSLGGLEDSIVRLSVAL